MADIVSSAVVQETVSKVLSNLVRKYEEKDESNKDMNLERLEMAHTRLEAVLEISDRWQITDASLLRWRSKLKRVAQECDDTLHNCKQRILEDEETEKEERKSSFPKRIARTTRSFVSSIFRPNKNEMMNTSIARRFEWFADGASEFIRLVELGGTPRHHMPFHPLNQYLLAGKKLHHRIIQENKRHLFLLLVPFTTSEYGIEARLIFIQKDGNVGEDDFLLTLMLQISESTDIIGITMKCIELFAPLFKSTVETIRKELMQLPIEDFSWVPNVDTHQKEQLNNILSLGTQWLRPNPLCCKQHDQHKVGHGSKLGVLGLRDVSLEPVISVNLQCHVSVSGCYKHRALLSEFRNSLQDSPSLKAGIVFSPHGYLEGYLPGDTSPAMAAIYTDEPHFLHTEFSFGQLEEIMLPKAIDYFYKNGKATIYQMLWRSKHGTAYIHVEKASIMMPSTHGTMQRKDEESINWSYGVSHFVNLWATDAPIRLQGSIKDWIQKESVSKSATNRSYKSCSTDGSVK
ncbi:unnamed protein product [Miscanthus lutarioriparius]|uniref:Disease resistance N-terminal domain-containing protein n=1 Tax=Miscanthus lutarioriparius TaxID=422564 RepID=A0A811NAA2_9POAL|nr:unnamed protein product [Miscanthus lutarioriparius]